MDATSAAARSACRQAVSRIDIEPEQRKHAVADKLVRLAACIDHRLRGGIEKSVDQEHDVERQPRLGELGRAAHVHEHADDVTLLADIDAAAVAHEVRHRYSAAESE